MKTILISIGMLFAASSALAHPLLVGSWQGPCIADDKGTSTSQTIRYTASEALKGQAKITTTLYHDATCSSERFYSIKKYHLELRESGLGDGIYEVDGVNIGKAEETFFDIVKMGEVNGFTRAIFGEAVADKDPSKRPTVLSTRDRIYLHFSE